MLGSGLHAAAVTAAAGNLEPGLSIHLSDMKPGIELLSLLQTLYCSVALRYQVVNYTGLQTIQFAINN